MQTSSAAAPVLPAPTFVDYFLMLLGGGLSCLLAELSGLHADVAGSGFQRAVHGVLPELLFLPMGIALFWPIFFSLQSLRGRQHGMTMGEWLWGVAWLANLFFATWFLWNGVATMPAFLDFKEQITMGYLLFLFLMAVVAALLLLLGFVQRGPIPWTHRFCLVLLIWPIVPLLIMWFGNIKFAF